MTPPIVALTGYSGSGKDSVYRLLAERFRVARLAFADALKREVAAAWCIDLRVLHDPGLKGVPLHRLALRRCTDLDFAADHWHLADLDALKPRTVMQAWGDWMNRRDPGRYVRILRSQLLDVMAAGPEAVLITDLRLQPEYDWLRPIATAIWRVRNPRQAMPPSGHSTERHQMHWTVDAEIVNDGGPEQLAKIASDLMLAVLRP